MFQPAIKVVVVEDEALLRDLLRTVCVREFNFDVMAAVSDGLEAVDVICEHNPDLVLLDLRLPGLDGLDVVQAIRARGRFPHVLVISAICNAYTVFKIERAGVHGFLAKSATMLPDLRRAMTAVARGDQFFCPLFQSFKAARLNDAVFFDKILSTREQTVLAMLSDRLTDAEIGIALGVSPRTVETHRTNILRKLRFRSRLDLERYARQCGFTQSWQVTTT